MKAKLSLDKKLILGFFARHGEKIAFVGIAICALALVYLATRGEKFDKTPSQLRQTADDANRVIDQADPKVAVDIDDPTRKINSIAAPTVQPYELTTLLDPPTREPKTLRGEPVLLAVEQLRGTGGAARFSQSAMGMGGGIAGGEFGPGGGAQQPALGQRWTLITGVVNYEKLHQLFYECFKGTKKHTEADYWPVVVGFDVERAEVTSDSEPVENLKWSQPYKDWWVEYKRFMATTDLAEPKFLHPPLVFPLPPRFDGQSWGKDAVHPPEIPLYAFDPRSPGQIPQVPPGGNAPKAGDPFAGGGAAGMGNAGMMGRPGPMGGGMVMGGMGGEIGGGPMAGPAMQPGFAGGMGGTGTPVGPLLLFRFFDYNVEPGKRYRYRARIVVRNPNFAYTAQDLQKELRNRMSDPTKWQENLRSPWSESSEVVYVPRDDRLLAVSVTSSKGIDRDPWGNVMAIHWDVQKGEEVHGEFKVLRGTLANFLDQKVAVAQTPGMLPQGGPPAIGPGPEGEMGLPPGGPPEGAPGRGRRGGRQRQPAQRPAPKPPAVKPETVDYVTDMLVLDLRGGDRLAGKSRLAWPGEMLLLDPDGNLQVRSDVEDAPACLTQRNAVAAQPGMGLPMGPMGPAGMPGPAIEGPGMLGP